MVEFDEAATWDNGQTKNGKYLGNNNWWVDYYSGSGKKDRDERLELLSWDKSKHGRTDVRIFYGYRNAKGEDAWKNDANVRGLTKDGEELGPIRDLSNYTECRWDPNDDSLPKLFKTSVVTDWNICYSTEALKFAQAGYLVSIVCVQWADLMICKTRNLSLAQQGMINTMGNFGLFFETSLVALLLYIPALNIGLGTRQIPPAHFAAPSFSFFVAIFFYDELRKMWLRDGMVRENGRLKLKGWITRNTYY